MRRHQQYVVPQKIPSRTSLSRYLDFAILHGRLQVLTATEPEPILFARLLRARCFLCDSKYIEAQVWPHTSAWSLALDACVLLSFQQEADRVLLQRRGSPEALYIKAESLYHQCKVRRATKGKTDVLYYP